MTILIPPASQITFCIYALTIFVCLKIYFRLKHTKELMQDVFNFECPPLCITPNTFVDYAYILISSYYLYKVIADINLFTLSCLLINFFIVFALCSTNIFTTDRRIIFFNMFSKKIYLISDIKEFEYEKGLFKRKRIKLTFKSKEVIYLEKNKSKGSLIAQRLIREAHREFKKYGYHPQLTLKLIQQRMLEKNNV